MKEIVERVHSRRKRGRTQKTEADVTIGRRPAGLAAEIKRIREPLQGVESLSGIVKVTGSSRADIIRIPDYGIIPHSDVDRIQRICPGVLDNITEDDEEVREW